MSSNKMARYPSSFSLHILCLYFCISLLIVNHQVLARNIANVPIERYHSMIFHDVNASSKGYYSETTKLNIGDIKTGVSGSSSPEGHHGNP